MAEKTNDFQRIYTIPLRRDYLKKPRSKRSNRAIREVKEYVRKHTKTSEVKVSKGLSELIFSRGFQKPPAKIKVEATGDMMSMIAKLPGEKIIAKKEEKKSGISGLKDRLAGKPAEETKEAVKEAVDEAAKEATSDEKIKEAAEKVKKEEKPKKEETKKDKTGKKEKK